MSTLDCARGRCGTLVDVRCGKPMSVQLPLGAAVYVVSGELWITQEGLYEDIVLAPGKRFDVERRGSIVLSAICDTAVAWFVPAPAIASRGTLPAGYHAVAAALRRRELARLVRLAHATVKRLLRRLRLTLRAALT